MVFDITQIVKQNVRKKDSDKIPLGTYASKCVSVEWAPGFKSESAFKMSYVLVSPQGEEFDHSEIFYNSQTPRSIEFFNYLFDHGIRNVFDFEGCEETVEVGYTVNGYKRYTGIIVRSFVEPKEEETL